MIIFASTYIYISNQWLFTIECQKYASNFSFTIGQPSARNLMDVFDYAFFMSLLSL